MSENVTIYDMVDNIVTVVFHTYYGYIHDQELKKDMIQQGYYKAYELLNNGNYDPEMSLRNFIFTGVRNEMHNMLYHMNKIQTVDLDQLDKYDNIVGYHETGEYNVTINRIKDITNIFKRNKDYFPVVHNYLLNLGLIEGEQLVVTDNLDSKMCESVITLVLWHLYNEEVNNG